MARQILWCAAVWLSAIGCSTGESRAVPARMSQDTGPIASGVVSWDKAEWSRNSWGEFRRIFGGETFGMKDLQVIAVTIQPGKQVHPPHRHEEEEFMFLAEGSGMWHLDGKDIPAKKGDTIYCAPWSLHGLKNVSDAPLINFVVKWNNKGLAAPEKPAAAK